MTLLISIIVKMCFAIQDFSIYTVFGLLYFCGLDRCKVLITGWAV